MMKLFQVLIPCYFHNPLHSGISGAAISRYCVKDGKSIYTCVSWFVGKKLRFIAEKTIELSWYHHWQHHRLLLWQAMVPPGDDNPDSKGHVANMGPTWVLSPPGGPHVGPMNLATRESWQCNNSGFSVVQCSAIISLSLFSRHTNEYRVWVVLELKVKSALCSSHCSAALEWHHTECDGISNHQPHGGLLNGLFRHRWKNTLKLCVTGLCVRGIHRWPVNSLHKGPVMQKVFPPS